MLLKECVNSLTTDDNFRKAKNGTAMKIYLNINKRMFNVSSDDILI
jgi:hypothetical protein|tara:strand:+ start:249 stop:386 length:138 start_codon:yes stop_codon:yes gene_type:complete